MEIYGKMEEDATQIAGFWKPVPGKINQIRIVTDPIRGTTAFKNGDQRVQYQFVVTTIEDPKTPVVWGVSAKGALQQILAIVKANSLQSLVGATLQVNVAGDGMERKYVILPTVLPSSESAAAMRTAFPMEMLEKTFPKVFAPQIPTAPAPQ
jgi:hypothetical protein